MTARPLSLGAVLHVAERMRAQDRAEIFARAWPGLDTPDALAMEVMRTAMQGWGATIHDTAGLPVAAMGLSPLWPGCVSAWMFATDAWRSVWRAAYRHARDVLFPTMAAAGVWRMQCHSLASHRDAHRFLLALGFAPEGGPVPMGRGREMFIPFARVTG